MTLLNTAELYNQPLAILPSSVGMLFHQRRYPLASSYGVIRSGIAAPVDVIGRRNENAWVAVMRLEGTPRQHSDSTGTHLESFGCEFRRLASLPSVKSIVIEVHSDGGPLFGVEEMSNLIYRTRIRKRVVAMINSLCSGSALWIASAAGEVIATPGADVGGLGIAIMHQDFSRAEAQEGVKTTLISYPARKVEGNQFEPLPDAVRARLQSDVRFAYRRFLNGIARNRQVSTFDADREFGRGGLLNSDDALTAHLVDRIAPKHEVIEGELRRLQSDGGQIKNTRNRLTIARLLGEI